MIKRKEIENNATMVLFVGLSLDVETTILKLILKFGKKTKGKGIKI